MQYIVSDAHLGLAAARKKVFGGTCWQRCQFHLSANAIQYAPTLKIKKSIGAELREIWNAPDKSTAEERLAELVKKYSKSAGRLSNWLEKNLAEGFAVFKLPEEHRKKMRTPNAIERAVQQEIKRRTRKIRIFPNEASLERLVTAVLVEINEKWIAKKTPYINWEVTD